MKTFLSPLTPEQENECLKKLKKGSLEARNELTLHNMRLVAHVAKKYQNSEEDMEDLISDRMYRTDQSSEFFRFRKRQAGYVCLSLYR